MKIDLDAARAARKEAEREEHTVVFGGQEFSLPPRLTIRASIAAGKNDLEEFLRGLLGDEGYEVFMAGNPDDLDLKEITDRLEEVYGVEMGNSPASVSSSKKSGKRSRQTSKGSTESTSLKPVSEPTP